MPNSSEFLWQRKMHIVGVFPAHTQLIVRFGEPSPHGFVLVPEYGKTLSVVPHRLEKRPMHYKPLEQGMVYHSSHNTFKCGGFSRAHSAHYPLWGAKPAQICPRPRVWEDFECSPTSVREAPHACLISPWSKAWCTTRPHTKRNISFKRLEHIFYCNKCR